MISEKSQKAIKELSEHVAVENGNVQIGKDLEVDGEAIFAGGQVAIGREGLRHDYVLGIYRVNDSGIFTGTLLGEGMVTEPDKVDFYGLKYIGDTPNGARIGQFIYNLKTGAFESDKSVALGDLAKIAKTFRHSLTLTCGTTATYYIDYYSKNNLLIDSIQDLTTITGGHAFGCGSAQATYTSNVWSIGGANLTAVSDVVTTLTD